VKRVGDPIARGWWLADAVRDDDRTPVLHGGADADVCIVGGGFTGLWTALRIKELAPTTDVVLIEREICGSGASGRNGGCAMTLWHHFLLLERLCGAPEALRIARASTEAVAEINEVCKNSGIDIGFEEHGWIWTATSPNQLGAWQATLDALERLDTKVFAELTREEVADRTGTTCNIAGVFEPGLASLQPAATAQALRLVALDRGVRIHEYSPMVELQRGDPPVVRTAHGSITAKRVVIAMQCWSGSLPELRNKYLTLGGDLLMTEPAPQVMQEIGIEPGLLVSDSRLLVHYYHARPDGRMAFGKAGGTFRPGNLVGTKYEGRSRNEEWIKSSLYAFYPTLRTVPVAATWSGAVDRSMDGLPFFTRLGRPDIIGGLGYSGNGVGPSVLGGKILASMALDRLDDWSRCGLVRQPPGFLPPEPLRYVGGSLVKMAVSRKERAEDAGKNPSRLDRLLTRMAPPGLVPTD